jgi:hypothetical protein
VTCNIGKYAKFTCKFTTFIILNAVYPLAEICVAVKQEKFIVLFSGIQEKKKISRKLIGSKAGPNA